jgi:hypothetical protein
MKTLMAVILCIMLGAASLAGAVGDYRGDKRCPPPKDWSKYSEPYNPYEHPNDYPTFNKADKPGWSCSYQREDGVIVQYGDSRTPQEQWLFTWGDHKNGKK